MSEDMNFMKNDMQDYYKKMGIRLAFSGTKVNRSWDECAEPVFSLICANMTNAKGAQKAAKKEKKQQEEAEPKLTPFEEMLKKNLSSYYRQLARTWHPDLEQNSRQKVLKEALIKKLTLTYKNNDLCELLALKMEWIDNPSGQTRALSVVAEMFLGHKHVYVAQFYGHGVDGRSKINFKYGARNGGVRKYKTLVKTIQAPKEI